MPFLLIKLLGFGKLAMEFVLGLLKAVFKFATQRPVEFLAIVLSITLVWAGWYGYQTKTELVKTQKVVEEKVTFIKGQDKTIKEYVKALDVEKKSHVSDIRKSNDAVSSIKKTADAALARAQAAAHAAEKNKAKFDDLATIYGRSNSSQGSAEDRIKREEATNDEFFKDWRKAK